jgi:methylated-DNA-[protein]-cysteine S-methyltransferase
MMKNVFFYNFSLCALGIAEEDGAISEIFFAKEKNHADLIRAETPLIKRAAAQFDEYFEGKRKKFDLPLALHGTEFQVKVWKALQKIPYGKTASYADIAAEIGNPSACRAVGMANNRNPIVIVVPCHRVIGKDGGLTGYGGGLDLKKKLLDLEKKH